jgi:phage baseplate assembly protein W|tara:strand:+ start:2299 stop:2712 length:414 start_codon:yes stop_codon:yes gene_type:complete
VPAYRFRSEKFFSRGFKDLAISLKANPNTKDFSAVRNENAIKQSVRNLVLTQFGERPYQYDIGSRVTGLLFEPFDVFLAEDLRDEIYNTIQRLEPRVEVDAVNVREGIDENSIDIGIRYTIIGQQQSQTVEFLLERT